MNKELFGVFGDRDAWRGLRDERAFDIVLDGRAVTVGIRDPTAGIPGRTAWYEGAHGFAVVWGEAFGPRSSSEDPAAWLLDAYATRGTDAFDDLNGSYLAAVEHDGDAVVATDPIRSWECFHVETDEGRVFGSDVDSVRRAVENPAPDRQSLAEYLHLGTVLGERTLFEEVSRVPFDGYLTPDGAREFRRFVYEPAPADHSAELADRLQRAMSRRSHYPGKKGLLLSAGQDARTLLSGIPDIEETYTLGAEGSREAGVARRLASQYGASHVALDPSDRYLVPDAKKVRAGQSIKESIHIHHAGYDDAIDVDTIYHGLLYDTLLKGHFLARDSVSVGGHSLPLRRLDPDPEPVEWLLNKLGFYPDASRQMGDAVASTFGDLPVSDPVAFLRNALEGELDRCYERADGPYNAMEQLVIRNQPVMPFRNHLADSYLEAFVAVDMELLDWHLTTPPGDRHAGTFTSAIRRIDDGILRHRPPDEPHGHPALNELQRFLRKAVPFAPAFEHAWPDTDEIHETYGVGKRLFPDDERVRELPARLQLRVNDARHWLAEDGTTGPVTTTADIRQLTRHLEDH